MAGARTRVREMHRVPISSDYLDPIPVKRERQRSEYEGKWKEESVDGGGGGGGEKEHKLFIIPTKGKSLFTFVISIELIRWYSVG